MISCVSVLFSTNFTDASVIDDFFINFLNREDAKNARVLGGRSHPQPVHHSFYAVLHQWYIPVQKESEFKIGKFKISQELGFVGEEYTN